MEEQLVCNINFYLYTRFVFGVYHKFQTSRRVRWLARGYCCLICASVIFFLLYFQSDHSYPKYLLYLMSMEYMLYMLFSLVKNNKYLLQYYKKTPFIDSNASTYKSMRASLIGFICVNFLVKIVGFIKIVVIYWDQSILDNSFALLESITWFAVLIGRSPLLFVFALLYTRVRLMRQTLENNNFDCRTQGNNHPQRYIKMYEAIMDGLEECDGPVKLQLFVFVLSSVTFYLIGTLYCLYFLKNYDTYGISKLELLWFMIEMTIGCSPLFLSAVLADMVSMETQEILVIVLERRIACNNERDREEIQQLFQFLRSNPFEYSLWRVVPLNVRTLLSFVSFSVTTIIAILQLQDWAS